MYFLYRDYCDRYEVIFTLKWVKKNETVSKNTKNQ